MISKLGILETIGDEEKFIENILRWQRRYDVLSHDRCLIMKFGHLQPFTHPSLQLTLEPGYQLNVGTLGSYSPSKCSIVVIGGKYLEQVDEVMRMVDKITEDLDWMPYAVFLMAEKPGQAIKINVSTRGSTSPTIYQVPATRSSVVQFVMTCPGMSHSSTFTLHMRDSGEVDDGKVWGDLCRERRVNIAYNNDPPYFAIDNKTGELVRYPINPISGVFSAIPYDWEILDSFFMNHAIVPIWIDCHFTWGWFDENSGTWTGALSKVKSL